MSMPVNPPAYTALYPDSSQSGTEAPPKYVVNAKGIRGLNPEWKKFKEKAHQPPPEHPVVSSMENHAALNVALESRGLDPVPLAPSTDAAVEMLQERENANAIGLAPGVVVDEIGATFERLGIPMGMMNYLMALSDLDGLEFLVDDSYSMNSKSKDNGTRWLEALNDLKTSIQILAYIPCPSIKVCFLNRRDQILIRHEKGETPEKFVERAHKQIDTVFKALPDGGTPVLRNLERSFAEGRGQKIARYIFGDGVPSDGKKEIRDIANLLNLRENPRNNPFTLFACSDTDDDVAWMGDVEEAVDVCASYDDYKSERGEVEGDQGKNFPFTKGMYLVCRLVGAMHRVLDAFDESTPLSKEEYENIEGVKVPEEQYRFYFDGFLEAQRCRQGRKLSDDIKKHANWESIYNELLTATSAVDIAQVKDYKAKLKDALMQEQAKK